MMISSSAARDNASDAGAGAEVTAARLARVRARIADAARRAGRDPAEVALVAVTKSVDPEVAAQLVAAGQRVLAENRVDKFLEKRAAIPEAAIHLIGTLQTNKVRFVVGQTPLIHAVDSRRLLEKIQSRAEALDVIQPVLLEVNISGEDSKHGLTPSEARAVVTAVATGVLHSSHLQINGLMTMAPLDSPEAVRWVFRDLRDLRDDLRETLRCAPQRERAPLRELSMGMSNDFEVAVEEGATLVRVGTALFKETG
ncbi:MAG: YggS family pyridoxal phosphate-dependent enzyme [Actinomycetia bacterium]|nr:YggS family pyridoxal phosphate-dependent enzyme [Actinomycetes bacterium]